MKRERAEHQALFPSNKRPIGDEKLQENRNRLVKHLKGLDCERDVMATLGVPDAKQARSRHRRVLSARTGVGQVASQKKHMVDQIITMAYFKDIEGASQREGKLQKGMSPSTKTVLSQTQAFLYQNASPASLLRSELSSRQLLPKSLKKKVSLANTNSGTFYSPP